MIPSPLGTLHLSAGGGCLTGLWFQGQRHFPQGLETLPERAELPVFRETAAWLGAYFTGRDLPPLPPLAPQGTTFQQKIWRTLLAIPWGQTRTYGDLARELGSSPRAIGGAVGRNPVSILIPCHRVIGADGGLTGYAGGEDRKKYLLDLERRSGKKRDVSRYLPEPSAAPAEARPAPPPTPGKFPCPCCGCKTFPVPKEEAVAYICPVCFWENDVFDPGKDDPSDENGGMTLREGRENFLSCGAVRPDLAKYVRPPRPGERPQ